MSAEGPTFAERLRALADLYEQHPDLPVPNGGVRLYLRGSHANERDGLAVARAVATADLKIDEYYVAVPIGNGFSLMFHKSAVGETRTVLREVVEYVLPEPAAVSP